MKLHYTTMLLFCFPLNVLAHNKNKAYIIPRHTRTSTSRVLRECDTSTSVYDNDPEMKSVKENFDRQTSHRFEEYEERMNVKRQKCKEQCDKEIQKIILKDKLEKQMTEQLTTLETNITTEDIPTCICEKSLADKVEKGCLRCGSVFGGGIAPNVGLLGGIGEAAISAWKPKAIAAAIVSAKKAGAAEGAIAGNAHAMNMVITFLKQWGIEEYCPEIFNSFVSTNRYADLTTITGAIITKHDKICAMSASGGSVNEATCKAFDIALGLKNANGTQIGAPASKAIPQMINGLAGKAETTANIHGADVTSKITTQLRTEQTTAINATYASYEITIIAAVVAIVVIVLIMVIIYLILRYRRKKKMKKKLQYIKLLEE
ncbi:hypothetical protein PFNF135_00401 [Plasmodium falciparum NF135/5.C10]|uniref:Surface antigen n=1 Tax=Plasmodium falciparum NF135/5.C10 TaxID=1036726 RepID=W4INR4_PLAFA|nr:hypothetical protein PFNF135_00401 [Plasmodium falciparum NF135/5.C10]